MSAVEQPPDKFCFVICPIGDEGSAIRRKSDGFKDEIVKPALGDGWRIERANDSNEPGLITWQILTKIKDADLCVVDITGHNPNVIYELAVCHAAAKRCIVMMEYGTTPTFDVKDMRAIPYYHDLAGRMDAVGRLKEAWRFLESNGFTTSNPISGVLDFERLKSSGTESAVMTAILEALSTRVSALEVQTASGAVSSPETVLLHDAGKLRVVRHWLQEDPTLQDRSIRLITIERRATKLVVWANLNGGTVGIRVASSLAEPDRVTFQHVHDALIARDTALKGALAV
ncbi:MAG TPA: hypothetical protein VGM77_07020 [Gemmatimonadales bacterium]